MDGSRTLLVDASSLIFRALFSTPDTVRTPDGVPINAAYGFLWMLARLVADHDPDYIACASDEDWRPAWRVELIPGYKSARAAPDSAQEEADDLLSSQVPALFAFLDLIGVPVVGLPDYEAEDVIGTLTARAPGRVAIVSGDRDLFQLVEDPRCYVIFPVRGVSKVDIVDEAHISNKYGIPGRAYLDYALLRGDPSDGLPGIRGIGDKGAAALLARYGSLDGIMAQARGGGGGSLIAKVRRDLDYLETARKVATIPRDLPVPELDLTRPRAFDEEVVMAGATRLGLADPAAALLRALSSGVI